MGWNNCTQAEAQDCYDAAQSRFNNAAEEFISAGKKIHGYGDVYRQTAAQAESMRSDKLNFNFAESIICSGVNCPSITRALRTPFVSENQFSLTALSELKKEKRRLELAIRDVNAKLSAMEQEMEELNKQMNALTQLQADLRKVINGSVYEMNHYKKYL